MEEAPKFVKTDDACIVTVETSQLLCMELFTGYPPLGRFAVREMRWTIAVGVVKSAEKKRGAAKIVKTK